MSATTKLRLILIKPSKYNTDGFVERFRWGSMPNSTLPYMRSLTPTDLAGFVGRRYPPGPATLRGCVKAFMYTEARLSPAAAAR